MLVGMSPPGFVLMAVAPRQQEKMSQKNGRFPRRSTPYPLSHICAKWRREER